MAVKTNNTNSREPLGCKIFTITAKIESILTAQLIHSKPCRAMNKESETASDRELFSELVEAPIHPLLINIVSPFVNETNPVFHFQLNGEAL